MPCVHSQMNRGPPFGPKLPRSGRVPSLPFLPAPTVYSARHPAGLLHPATSHGVRRVSGRGPKTRRSSAHVRPHDAQPFGVFPSPAASLASPRLPEFTVRSCPRAVAPSPSASVCRVATTRLRILAGHSTSGRCSTEESVARPRALPPATCSILPWALIQLRFGDGRIHSPKGAAPHRPSPESPKEPTRESSSLSIVRKTEPEDSMAPLTEARGDSSHRSARRSPPAPKCRGPQLYRSTSASRQPPKRLWATTVDPRSTNRSWKTAQAG
jgi:hypothetical protein